MGRSFKNFLILLLQSSVFWIIAFTIFMMIRYYGIEEEQAIELEQKFVIPMYEWIDITIMAGIIIGFIYALVETIFEKYISQYLILAITIALKIIIYLIALIFTITLVSHYTELKMDIDLNNELGWWQTSKTFWLIVGFFIFSSLVFSFIKISNEKFGKGIFLKMLLGKYRKPREEKRVFMFLDLKSSTAIAEELGHLKYSSFIQDCFYDLNVLLNAYSAEVYQYVGDEAVISWPYRRAVRDTKCMDFFFAFNKRLTRRKKHYMRKYGRLPEFKAGLHGGTLTITEVGTVKKELAFHGDVINTTSRIQDECNTYDEQFLISQELLEDIKGVHKFDITSIGKIDLKGKEEDIIVHAVKLKQKVKN